MQFSSLVCYTECFGKNGYDNLVENIVGYQAQSQFLIQWSRPSCCYTDSMIHSHLGDMWFLIMLWIHFCAAWLTFLRSLHESWVVFHWAFEDSVKSYMAYMVYIIIYGICNYIPVISVGDLQPPPEVATVISVVQKSAVVSRELEALPGSWQP